MGILIASAVFLLFRISCLLRRRGNTLHSLVTSSKQVQGGEGSGVARPAAKGAGAGGVAGAVLDAGAGFGARAGHPGGISGATARGEKMKVPAEAIVDFTFDHPVTLPVVEG